MLICFQTNKGSDLANTCLIHLITSLKIKFNSSKLFITRIRTMGNVKYSKIQAVRQHPSEKLGLRKKTAFIQKQAPKSNHNGKLRSSKSVVYLIMERI